MQFLVLTFIDASWLESWTWQSIAVAVITVVVGLAALVKAAKDIRKDGWEPFRERWITPRRSRRQRLDELIAKVDARFSEITQKIDERGEKIDRIDKELRTNGGSSLKDYVIGIVDRVEQIQARVRYQDETSTVAKFELDPTGGMTLANAAFRELLNAEECELTHRDYISRAHRDDKTRVIHELQEAIDNKMPLDITANFRLDDKGKHFVQIRLCANPNVRSSTSDKPSELLGFFGIATKVEP